MIKLIHGNAVAELKKLKETSFQSIITSPPYWGLRSYGHADEIGAEPILDDYLDAISHVFSLANRVLKDDGVLWINLGDTYTSGNRSYRDSDEYSPHRGMQSRPRTPAGLKSKDLIGLPWRVAFRLQSDGWYLRSSIVWHKNNPVPESVKDRPHQAHEYLFMLSKAPTYRFNLDSLKSLDGNRKNFSRSVWSISVGGDSNGHAAPFPVELVEPCILSSSDVGDKILDPFAGSASVGIACAKLKRGFVGIELVPENVDKARARLSAR